MAGVGQRIGDFPLAGPAPRAVFSIVAGTVVASISPVMTPAYTLRAAGGAALLALVSTLALATPEAAQSPSAPAPTGQRRSAALERAREAFSQGRLDEAEHLYQQTLISDRANVDAMLELANVYERRGKLEYARGLLKRARSLRPHDDAVARRLSAVERLLVHVLEEEADSLMADRRYAEAAPKLSMLLSVRPRDADLHFKKALCYLRSGRPDAALSDIDRAISIDRQERYEHLRSEILDAIQVQETRERVARAQRLMNTNKLGAREEALRLIRGVLADDPGNEWARSALADLSASAPPPAPRTGTDSTFAGPGPIERAATGIRDAARAVSRRIARHIWVLAGILMAVVVFRSPLTRWMLRSFARTPVLGGHLDHFGLGEVLTMINSSPRPGVLHVKGPSCRGRIYFEAGEPCHCVAGKRAGEDALFYLLAHASSGRFAFTDGVVSARRTIESPLSLLLVEQARATATPSSGKSQKRGVTPSAERRNARSAKGESRSRMRELLESRSDRS